ncbi:unnamed protein product, partial [Nesidiocoris tenuis]
MKAGGRRTKTTAGSKKCSNENESKFGLCNDETNIPQDSAYTVESLMNSFPLPDHLLNYNAILMRLLEKKARDVPPTTCKSSYDDWCKKQDEIASLRSINERINDISKIRAEMAVDQFVCNLNWETMDIINYLVSDKQLMGKTKSTSSLSTSAASPIVMMAKVKSEKKKSPKTPKKDQSKNTAKSKKSKKSEGKTKSTTSKSSHDRPVLLPPEALTVKRKPTYKLSNYDYLKLGWTRIPDYSISFKVFTLGVEPAFPALWPFRDRTDGQIVHYPGTERMAANFEGLPPYYIYHPNGEVAISISKGRVGPRMTVRSMSKKNETGAWIESRPVAMFDSKGNGVVYDTDGRIKMNYDQVEGALYPASQK